MAAPLEHKHARGNRDPGEWAHFWQQFQYRWECDNEEMDDIWLEWDSWTESVCGFIPSVLTRLDHRLQPAPRTWISRCVSTSWPWTEKSNNHGIAAPGLRLRDPHRWKQGTRVPDMLGLDLR